MSSTPKRSVNRGSIGEYGGLTLLHPLSERIWASVDFGMHWVPTSHRHRGMTCMCVSTVLNSFSRIQLFVTSWSTAHQTPLFMGFSRYEFWSGLPGPPSGDLPHPGIKSRSPVSPALQVILYCWANQENPRGDIIYQ